MRSGWDAPCGAAAATSARLGAAALARGVGVGLGHGRRARPRSARPAARRAARRATTSARSLSASTSSSIVRLKSLEALRNSASIRPMLLPISGSPRAEDDEGDDQDQEDLGPAEGAEHGAAPIRTTTAPSVDRNPLKPIHFRVLVRIRGAPRGGAVIAAFRPLRARRHPRRRARRASSMPSAPATWSAAIDSADAAGAPLVVLRLDTPGGLDTSMRQIIDKMLNCRTPVAVFVGPSGARAASAGFVITHGRRRGGHGARHQHRRRAPGVRPGRQHGRGDVAGRSPPTPPPTSAARPSAAAATWRWRRRRCWRAGRSRSARRWTRELDRPRGQGRPRAASAPSKGARSRRFDGTHGHAAAGRPAHDAGGHELAAAGPVR